MYPGTSGRTQGDRKEIAPAANALRTPTLESSGIHPPSRCGLFRAITPLVNLHSMLPRRPPNRRGWGNRGDRRPGRSEEHTSELQSLMRNSYAVFCLKKKKHTTTYYI